MILTDSTSMGESLWKPRKGRGLNPSDLVRNERIRCQENSGLTTSLVLASVVRIG